MPAQQDTKPACVMHTAITAVTSARVMLKDRALPVEQAQAMLVSAAVAYMTCRGLHPEREVSKDVCILYQGAVPLMPGVQHVSLLLFCWSSLPQSLMAH